MTTLKKTYWVVHGSFLSLPEQKETWHELESYPTLEEAKTNAKNTNEKGLYIKSYHKYRIIKRTCRDEIYA